MADSGNSRVTMKDVAQICGYTVNTVSRALRGDVKLPAATREKIRKTAYEMGYIQNSMAYALRKGKSHIVAVIVNNVENPYFSVTLAKMDAELRKAGYNMMILCTQEDATLADQIVRVAISQSVDGVFYTPYNDTTGNIEYLKRNRMPFVVLDRRTDGVEADSVRCDDLAGGFLAGRHLTQLGHRKFLYLAGDVVNTSEVDRRAGFLNALGESGIEPSSVRIVRWSEFDKANAENALDKLLLPLDYTAAVAFSDQMACYALNFYRDKNIGVPRDVSLISFDHIRGSLRYFDRITSIAQISGSIAESAVRFLLNRIKDVSLPPQVEVLPVRIYDEGTTAPPVIEL